MPSFLRLERKQKNASNAFRNRLFPLCSYSSGIERINTFIRTRISLENRTRFQNEQSVYPFSDQTPLPNREARYLYGIYRGVPPTPTPGDQNRERFDNFFTVFKPAVEWPKSELLT